MWWWSAAAWAHVPTLLFAGPTDDWCQIFRDAAAGDIILLAPGDYTGACTLTGKPPDADMEYSVLTAQDADDRPRFHWDGTSDHVLELAGARVQLAWLAFDDIPPDVRAVQIADGTEHWLLDLDLPAIRGVGVSVTGGADLVRLTELELRGDGVGIALDGAGSVSVEDAWIATAGGGLTGGATALTLRDAVIDAPAALSLTGPADASRNLLRGAVQVGGPGAWESNVVVGPVTGPARDLRLYGNSLRDPAGVPLTLTGPTDGLVVQNNAVNAPITAGDAGGNVDCAAASCWRDPDALDFYPAAAGPLAAAGVASDAGVLFGDWCGFSRGAPPTPGALEDYGAPFGPLSFTGFKRDIDCGDAAPLADTGREPADTGAPADVTTPPSASGCGCQSGPPAAAGGLLALVAAICLRGSRPRRLHYPLGRGDHELDDRSGAVGGLSQR